MFCLLLIIHNVRNDNLAVFGDYDGMIGRGKGNLCIGHCNVTANFVLFTVFRLLLCMPW